MKKFCKLSVISSVILLNIFTNCWAQEKSLPLESFSQPNEAYPEVKSVCPVFSDNKPKEEWEVTTPLSPEDLQERFKKTNNSLIIIQIIPNLSGESSKNITFLNEVLSDQTTIQKQYPHLYKIPFSESTTIQTQLLVKELKDIKKEREKISNSLSEKEISDIEQTAVDSYIKFWIPSLKQIQQKTDSLPSSSELQEFRSGLNSFIGKFQLVPDYLIYVRQWQDSIIQNEILKNLLRSNTTKAQDNAKYLNFAYEILSNKHSLQGEYPQLKVGNPAHSWFKIIIGWKCLAKRTADISKDDDELEEEMCKTLKLHEKLFLTKFPNLLQEIPNNGGNSFILKINEFKETLNQMNAKYRNVYSCENCLPIARMGAFGDSDCH